MHHLYKEFKHQEKLFIAYIIKQKQKQTNNKHSVPVMYAGIESSRVLKRNQQQKLKFVSNFVLCSAGKPDWGSPTDFPSYIAAGAFETHFDQMTAITKDWIVHTAVISFHLKTWFCKRIEESTFSKRKKNLSLYYTEWYTWILMGPESPDSNKMLKPGFKSLCTVHCFISTINTQFTKIKCIENGYVI